MEKRNRRNRDKNSMWKIDKRMLPYKIHFFLYMGAMGALLPYHPSIGISRLGLGAGNLAVVYTIQHFFVTAFKPVIGYTTDYFNNLKGMIVMLTVINAILSFLFLAIPKVEVRNDYAQLTKLSTQINFCKICSVSSEFAKMVKHIPFGTGDFNDDIFCREENAVSENFADYCPQNSNSSNSFNIMYKIEIRTCYETKNSSKQSKDADMAVLSNQSSTIFIKMYHNWNSSELIIVCHNIENSSRLQTINFTLNDIAKSCFKYTQHDFFPKNVTLEEYPSPTSNIDCNDTKMSENSKQLGNIKSDSFKTYQFWLYILILVFSVTCVGSIFTLSDTACYETVQQTGADYGKQRTWGAIGWGLLAPFSGFVIDYTDNYWSAMIIMSFLCTLEIWNLTRINLVKPQYSQSILKNVKAILSSSEFIAFEIGVFLNGIATGIVWHFLAWFITDIGGSRLLIGLAGTVQCFLGEVPFMFFSSWLIRKIGHLNVISLALISQSIRFLSYSSLNNPWLILPVECLDGISFGAFYAAMTSYCKMKAKPGTEATTQSLTCAIYDGLGAGMGTVIAGTCFHYYGGYTTFFYAGLCFAGAASVNVTSTVILHFKKRPSETIKEETELNKPLET